MSLLSKSLLIIYLILSSFLPIEISSKEGLNRDTKGSIKSEEIDKSLDDKNYIIGPGDIFTIDLPEQKSIVKSEIKVIKTGKAYIPIIGEVFLEGLTYGEAYQLIKNKFSNELISPELTLKLIYPRPVLISVIGEVREPGIYTMSSKADNDKSNSYHRIVDALLKAGGLTKDSNIKNIELVRKLPESKGGGYKKANLDLYELVYNGNHSQNPILFDGDFINVPKADASQRLPTTNFTNTLIEVHVVGEVKMPGKILIKNGTKLAQAVYYAGGPLDLRANINKVQLVRTNQNGSITLDKYNLKLKGSNPKIKNPTLQNGDIVRVSSTVLSKTSDIIRETTAPVLNIFALYKIFE